MLARLQPDHCHFCLGLAAAHLQFQVLLHCSLPTGMQTEQPLTCSSTTVSTPLPGWFIMELNS